MITTMAIITIIPIIIITVTRFSGVNCDSFDETVDKIFVSGSSPFVISDGGYSMAIWAIWENILVMQVSSQESVYIYEYSSASNDVGLDLVYIDNLTQPVDSNFGNSIDIYNNVIIIGASSVDSAFIYHYNTTSSKYDLVEQLSGNGGSTGDGFGYSVAICDEFGIVGTRDGEAAYIFKHILANGTDSGGWMQVLRLVASDATSDRMYFGLTVDIVDLAENFAMVGAPYDNSYTGSVYIFEFNCTINTTCNVIRETKLEGNTTLNSYTMLFGRDVIISTSVSNSGTLAIVSTSNVYCQYGVHVFEYNRTSKEWRKQVKIGGTQSEVVSFTVLILFLFCFFFHYVYTRLLQNEPP